ncbi:MAG TPA: type III PLP-dependent enzyme [Steroidobacteraceae bacterium]|nr:type III PLP-dependent enzyme [Steroidobacteraceae bacterium]
MSKAPDLHALVAHHGTPLLLVDCDVVRRQYRALQRALPGVDLYYALKPLPHPAVVAELRELGASFDVATTGEIRLVRAAGVAAERCIHTHPIKSETDITAALRFGIRSFVADNPDEIRKFREFRRRCELLLRLSFRDPTAVVDLSRKFGCEPTAVPHLLELARELGVRVRGLSFHVGSQVADPAKYVEAIGACRELIEHARGTGRARLDLLDIGGGFPIGYRREPIPIDQFCKPIRRALRKLPRDVRVIAEPGRFIAGPAGTAVTRVVGRAQREGRWWYYLDDGMYGSYSGQIYDHATYPIEVPEREGPRHPSVLAGPTCDSIDVVREDVPLPELQIGDLVVGRLMGAYTWATSTEFNFIPRAKVVALNAQARLRA